MKKLFFLKGLLYLLLASQIVSCKKEEDKLLNPTNPASPTTIRISGSTWTWNYYYAGYPAITGAYLKFNTTGRFEANFRPPGTDGGTWSQDGKNVKFDFITGYHYKGVLVTNDSISGTMIDSTNLATGTWSAKLQGSIE